MNRIELQVWSDVACPWCYVGKRRLEAALASFTERERVDVRWRAFELNPAAPEVEAPLGYAQRLAAKYGTSVARGEEMIRTMTAAGAEAGVELRFDRIRPGNTFDAHRLIHLATAHGRGDAMKERLLRAYFTEGEAVGDHAALARLASEVELPADEVRALLAGEAYAEAVRADEAEARRLGIQGVPHFRIAGRFKLSGAQPPEMILHALNAAATTTQPPG